MHGFPDSPEDDGGAPAGAERKLLALVRELVEELQPGRRTLAGLSLDSLLVRELGLDSLARAELVGRVEKAFGVRLPAGMLAAAETPGDLLRAVRAAGPGAAGIVHGEPARPAGAAPGTAADFCPAPERTRTLLEALAWHAARHPERRHVTFLPDDGPPQPLTYGDLDRRARAVAAGLLRLGLARGQAAGIMLPSGHDYFAAFCGTLLAGAVPAPLYPPVRRSQIAEHLERQAAILETAGAGVLITFPEVLPLARLLRGRLSAPGRLATVEELAASGDSPALPALREIAESDVALLQFTSGSTGQPKGVVLTHANLLANLRAIGRAVPLGAADVAVSWLPLYHDMGLIGTWMGSLYFGVPLILLPPLSFLARPASWLRAIASYRGTISAAPNFAYELCAGKISDDDLLGVDLSSWRVALNGAEPVSPEAIRRFTERFAPYGFRPETMAPVYGLAECALALTFPPLGRGPRVDAVERATFERTGRALPAPGDPRALRFVSCGSPLSGHEVRVVDPLGNEAGEREEGVVQFRGPSATRGYFHNPEATRRLVRGFWLDSGDRGYLAGGELYITGRVKDIILRAGRNLYPQELEAAVGGIPGARRGCVAAFGAPEEASGTERLVVVVETRERQPGARERLREAIQAAAVELLGMPADEVVLAPPHAVLKTSSGKVRRAATRDAYLAGRLGGDGGGAWRLARFVAAGWRRRLAELGRAAGGALYDARVKLALAGTALPLWLGVALLPGLGRRRRLVRAGCRTALRLAGIRLRVVGEGPGGKAAGAAGPRIVVANHASHMDGAVLLAALDPDLTYVVERELLGNVFTRVLLRRLGALFVERFDVAESAGEVAQLAAAVARGASLVVFPEGLFRNAAGVQPFHLGAFVVAAGEGVPILPVALQGTRAVLHDYARHFRRGEVAVTVLPPIPPSGPGWPAAVALRDAARAAIVAACGEPDLAPEQVEL